MLKDCRSEQVFVQIIKSSIAIQSHFLENRGKGSDTVWVIFQVGKGVARHSLTHLDFFDFL